MERLLKLGVDPTGLYEQFRERAEERETIQEDFHLQVHNDLSADMNVREYRHFREAENMLVLESDTLPDDLTYSDYRKVREAEKRGETPLSYQEYRLLLEEHREKLGGQSPQGEEG